MTNFCELVQKELDRARSSHGNMKSIHEGLAVIWEEFEELKEEVFKKHAAPAYLKGELIQLAAMCQRMYEDVVAPQKEHFERRDN